MLGLGLLPFIKIARFSLSFSIPWQPRYPYCLLKKRKCDKECRGFQEIWSISCIFTEVNGIPVCLVCSQQVSVVKNNIRVFRKGCSLNVLI